MEKIVVKNPSDDYKIIDTFDATTEKEIDQKVALAKKNFLTWSTTSLTDRINILQKLFLEFKKNKNEIAELIALEVGMPISVCMKIDIEVGLEFMKGYLDNVQSWLAPEIVYETDQEIHTMYFESMGVIGISIPWNYPFTNFIWAVIPHLLAGNTVIIKHSEYSILATKLFEKIMNSVQGLLNVCHFVYGHGKDVGNYLIHSDVDALWFVGSTETGSIVYQAAAQKGIPIILELGGSAAALVFEDADVDMAIESLFFYRFLNSGQTCDGIKRLIVHESIFDAFVQKLVGYTKQQKVGPALDVDTKIGPLVNQKQLQTLEQQVTDAVEKGAQVVLGGKSPESLQAAFYEPTILTNISFDMTVWKEEVFGPVLPVVPFKTIDEAIRLANDSKYGLGGYVYTQNKDVALKTSQALKAGNISVNNANYVIPQNPFGGYKRASGFGRIHGKEGMRDLCNIKIIALKK